MQVHATLRYSAIMGGMAAQSAASGQDPAAAQATLAALFQHAEKLKAEAVEAAQRRAQ